MRKMKVAELVFDYTIYPRSSVDTQHVHYIRQAIQSGADLPPPIIDKKSKRIVDGFHRATAYLKQFGPDHEIEVIEKSYKSEGEMFLDCVRYNANHGRALSTFDRAHCIILAKQFKLEMEDVASALNLTVEAIDKLTAGRIGTLRVATRQADTDRHVEPVQIPLKRTIQHFAGKTINKRQEEANGKLSGMHQTFYVNQIIELVEAKLLDMDDAKLIERLRVLHGLLDDVLAVA